MENARAKKTLESISLALKNAGYDPYAQLTGYLETGDDSYITRKDGARDAIKLLDKDVIRAYLAEAEAPL